LLENAHIWSLKRTMSRQFSSLSSLLLDLES
jgi:hypothetical protein